MAMIATNLFKKIIDRELPAEILFEDDLCMAFKDVHPQAPTHWLIIPKKEIRTHADLMDEDQSLLGHLHMVARRLAAQHGVASYRMVVNCNEEAGQTVPHLHFHLLAGRRFGWPPG